MAYLPSPEVVVPNPPLRVRDVDRRPEVISKGAPHAVVAVDRDRVIDAERARLLDDVVDGSLEEFGLFPGREVTALVDVNPCSATWVASSITFARTRGTRTGLGPARLPLGCAVHRSGRQGLGPPGGQGARFEGIPDGASFDS
jgi:hypothetical protein